MPSPISDDDAEKIRAAVFAGRKIEAIKLYRESTGAGLKDAKDFIEALEQELREQVPHKFTAPPGGKGCGSAAAVLVVLVALGAVAI